MAKYEIMMIIDPKEENQESVKMAQEVFADFKEEVLKRTELAYEINNSTTAKYILASVEATGEQIKEFTRRSNIIKTLWRIMVINLDKEKNIEQSERILKEHSKRMAERAKERTSRDRGSYRKTTE